jgi:myo-inositol 2-dehydrogenase/D-chiro-inositol 1-dehydrogenase
LERSNQVERSNRDAESVGGANRVRIGVVGVGRMGQVHARTLRSHGQIVAVADVDLGRAEAFGAELGAEVLAVEDLLRSVDAVVIAAASSAHAELIHGCAGLGVPAFCEKPIALDLPSTVAAVEAVRAAGTVLQMGFQRRFDAGYRAAHDLVSDGSVGSLYIVRMAGHDPEPPHEEYIPVSGGIFRDFSVHDFDALRFVTGREVVEAYADGSVIGFPQFERYGDVDTAAAVLRLEGGALGILSVTRHDPLGYDIRMELFGSGDSIAVGVDGRTPLRSVEPDVPSPPGPAYRNFQERFTNAYRDEMLAFVEVAQGRRENPCTAEDALEALRVAVACDRSRAEHRPVLLEEVA